MNCVKCIKMLKIKRLNVNSILKSILICYVGQFITVARGHDEPTSEKTELVSQNSLSTDVSRKMDIPNIFMPNLGRSSRFLSLDSKSGDLEVNLELSVPFLTLPFENKSEKSGNLMPLLNINVKALIVFGALMAISAFIVPLFANNPMTEPSPDTAPPASEQFDKYYWNRWGKEHKRTNRGINLNVWNLHNSLYEILFQDSTISPCVQRIVCSAVVTSRHYNQPTSVEKIVDFLHRNKLFEKAVNDTLITDAVAKGYEAKGLKQCFSFYKGCIISRQLIRNIIKAIGG